MSGVERRRAVNAVAGLRRGFFHLLLLLFHLFFLDARDLRLQHLDLRFDQLLLFFDLFRIGIGVLQLHQLLLQSLNLPVQRLDARRGVAFIEVNRFVIAVGAFVFLRLAALRLVIDRFGHQQFALVAGSAKDVADAGNGVFDWYDHGNAGRHGCSP